MPVEESLTVIVGNAQRHYAAEMTLDEFLLTDSIEGRLLRVPIGELFTLKYGNVKVTASVRGKRYKFERLEKDGTFALRKDF